MKPYHAKITIHNTGAAAYHGDEGLANKNGSDWLDAVSCDVEPGETIDVNVTFLPKEAGTINYSVNDNMGNNLHQGTITVVEPDFSDNLDLIVTHNVTNAEGTEIFGPKAKIDLNVTNNNDKAYHGRFSILCYKWTGTNYKFEYTSATATIPAGKTEVLHMESPVLSGADYYSFSTMYMKGDQQVDQNSSDKYYTVAPYYIAYDAQGNQSVHRQAATLQPDADVCAIDLTHAPAVTSVGTAANPNLIIIADENSTMTGDNIVKGSQAENVRLTDGYPFYSPVTFNARHIGYTRTPEVYFDSKNSKGWSTIVLPFAPDGCQATIDGTVTPLSWRSSSSEGDIVVANFAFENGENMEFTLPEPALTASQPYLIGIPQATGSGISLTNVPITFYAQNAEVKAEKAVVTGRDYKMTGTLSGINATSNIYVLNADGSAFIAGTHPVKPFRAYFEQISSETAVSKLTISFDYGTHSGIADLSTPQPDNSQSPYYNINGQRIINPGSGIYIKDGKRILIK